MSKCDRWTLLRIVEVAFVIACLVAKRITDDETHSLFLYLNKFNRQTWSVLNSVTWDKVGSSVADAAYGGYTIILVCLLIGKIFGELPTKRRIVELVFLTVGAILFIVLGSLELAAIESLPHHLVDNAAILGTLTLITGILFLVDMGAPKDKSGSSRRGSMASIASRKVIIEDMPQLQPVPVQQIVVNEREIIRSEKSPKLNGTKRSGSIRSKNGSIRQKNGSTTRSKSPKSTRSKQTLQVQRPIVSNPTQTYTPPSPDVYKPIGEEDVPKKFGIYGKDVTDYATDTDDTTVIIPPKMEQHTPVWSNIRKGTTTGVVRGSEEVSHSTSSVTTTINLSERSTSPITRRTTRSRIRPVHSPKLGRRV